MPMSYYQSSRYKVLAAEKKEEIYLRGLAQKPEIKKSVLFERERSKSKIFSNKNPVAPTVKPNTPLRGNKAMRGLVASIGGNQNSGTIEPNSTVELGNQIQSLL